MALIVEDGTGITDANSYADAAHAGRFHDDRGLRDEWREVAEAGPDGWLIDASRLIDGTSNWIGSILTTTQGLGLPRSSITLPSGRVLDGEAQVALAADAASMLALRTWQKRPRPDSGGLIKRSETLPDYAVTYETEASDAEAFPEVTRILAPLLVAGGAAIGGIVGGKLVRWS